MVKKPFQTHEDTFLVPFTVTNPNTALTKGVTTRVTTFGVDPQGCKISLIIKTYRVKETLLVYADQYPLLPVPHVFYFLDP